MRVPALQDKALAEQVVARVDNVRSIINELGVMGTSSLAARSSDALITGKVKALMVDDKEILPTPSRWSPSGGVSHGPRDPARGRTRHRAGTHCQRSAKGWCGRLN